MMTTLSQRQFERQRGVGRRKSGHSYTAGQIAKAIDRAHRRGDKEEAHRLWVLLPSGEISRKPGLNQRQRRKARRQAAGMGCKGLSTERLKPGHQQHETTMKPNLTVMILMRAVRWLGHIAYWIRQCLADGADKEAVQHRDQVVRWTRAAFQHYQLRSNYERSLLPLTVEDRLAEGRAA